MCYCFKSLFWLPQVVRPSAGSSRRCGGTPRWHGALVARAGTWKQRNLGWVSRLTWVNQKKNGKKKFRERVRNWVDVFFFRNIRMMQMGMRPHFQVKCQQPNAKISLKTMVGSCYLSAWGTLECGITFLSKMKISSAGHFLNMTIMSCWIALKV